MSRDPSTNPTTSVFVPFFESGTHMKLKYAICQELFEDWEWERQCEFIAATGYSGIEVAPFTINEDARKIGPQTLAAMRKCAESNGLQIIGLHWLLAKTQGLHLTSSDAGARQRAADYLVVLSRMCAALGGDLLVFGSPDQRNVEDGMSTDQAMANAAEVFTSIMPAFADAGVRLCMEPLTKNETNFVNTCAQAMELIRMVDHPNMCLHQDVKAMLGAENETISELIFRHKHDVGHFHVNDTNLLGPGMGDTDYKPILSALIESDYSGWVSVEVFDYSPGAEVIAEKSLLYMQKIVAELH
jgi:sugar phosphate isomerase/epimerase